MEMSIFSSHVWCTAFFTKKLVKECHDFSPFDAPVPPLKIFRMRVKELDNISVVFRHVHFLSSVAPIDTYLRYLNAEYKMPYMSTSEKIFFCEILLIRHTP